MEMNTFKYCKGRISLYFPIHLSSYTHTMLKTTQLYTFWISRSKVECWIFQFRPQLYSEAFFWASLFFLIFLLGWRLHKIASSSRIWIYFPCFFILNQMRMEISALIFTPVTVVVLLCLWVWKRSLAVLLAFLAIMFIRLMANF